MNQVEIFAERLRAARQHRNLTQNALGQKLMIAKQQITLYESGRSLPSLEKAVEIARVLETTVDYLVGISHDLERSVPTFGDLDEAETEALKIMRSQSVEDKKRLVEVLRLSAR